MSVRGRQKARENNRRAGYIIVPELGASSENRLLFGILYSEINGLLKTDDSSSPFARPIAVPEASYQPGGTSSRNFDVPDNPPSG